MIGSRWLGSWFHSGFQSLHARLEQTDQRLDEKYELLIRRMDKRFLWTITTMLALLGMTVTIYKM